MSWGWLSFPSPLMITVQNLILTTCFSEKMNICKHNQEMGVKNQDCFSTLSVRSGWQGRPMHHWYRRARRRVLRPQVLQLLALGKTRTDSWVSGTGTSARPWEMVPLTGVPIGGPGGGFGRRPRSIPNRSLSWFAATRNHLGGECDHEAGWTTQSFTPPTVQLFATPWTNLPGSCVHGLLQARILEWVAIPFSRGSSPPRDQTRVSALQVDSLPSKPPGKCPLPLRHP